MNNPSSEYLYLNFQSYKKIMISTILSLHDKICAIKENRFLKTFTLSQNRQKIKGIFF